MPGPKHPKARLLIQKLLLQNTRSFRELEARVSALPTEKERGDAFEVFAEAYLATQPITQAKEVWPFDCIPPSVTQRLSLDTKRDMGVDGVFETLAGETSAYQVKFRSCRPSLTWRELSTFMGLADKVTQRVLFTNCDDLPALMNERGRFYCVRGSDLDKLEPKEFDAIEAWLEGAIPKREKKEPMPHQREALGNILPALETNDRVTAIMACGTGKTLVALWVAENMECGDLSPLSGAGDSSPAVVGDSTRQAAPKQSGDKSPHSKILVLVPSLALLRQTLHEWLKETRWESVAYLCVCSDPTVEKGMDDLIVRQSDLDFPVTTDSNVVRQFLLEGAAPSAPTVKIVFSTYHSADVVAAGMVVGHVPSRGETGKAPDGGIGPTAFDLAIFDEAHKTAGREGLKFSFALKDEKLPIRKRLFVTATPRHYDVRKRDKEGDAVLVYSMDNPSVYGPVAHKLTFAEAARRRIICNYKVIISVVTSDMVNDHMLRHGKVLVKGDEIHARQVANQLALKAAVEKHGVSKVFTFHRSVASAKSFVAPAVATVCDRREIEKKSALAERRYNSSGEGIGNHLSGFACFHVNGTMPTAYRERLMNEFRAAENAIISNAKCLTEGVDVPSVDMVAFLTPKRSRVDIVQATGRAMRTDPANSAKTTGYVLVPLFVEQAKGESLEAAIERTEFDEVWAVLQAMQEQDDVLDDRIHYVLATGKKTKGFNDAIIRQRVEITGPAVALDKLRRAITVKCLDRIGRRWDTMVQQLLLFRKRFGHLLVPRNARRPWKDLGEWVWTVRQAKRIGTLSEERVSELEVVGFDWRVKGQTLNDTTGLLNEAQFVKASGLTMIHSYRRQGLIKPVGWALSATQLSAYYRPSQIKELKKKLGITLDDTTGLLNEAEFVNAFRLTGIYGYRRQGLIKPVGWALATSRLSAYYHPRQIKELRKKLGITLDDTTGLLTEAVFADAVGVPKLTMARWRRESRVAPFGWAINRTGGSLRPFYTPSQIAEVKARRGITDINTKGLLSEQAFAAQFGITAGSIGKYRKQGLIKPVTQKPGPGRTGFIPFYDRKQIRELKAKLGITLVSTKGLLSEKQFMEASKLTNVARYRQRGLIKPVGRGFSGGGPSWFYRHSQIYELRKSLGITLASTKGLLTEKQFGIEFGLTKVGDYRKKGLIEPKGKGVRHGPIGFFYHPRQIKELKAKLKALKRKG